MNVATVCFAILAAVGLWAYWPTLATIVSVWGSDPDYTHGVLVAPIAAWLLWSRRDESPQVSVGSTGLGIWIGVGLLTVASVMRYVAGRFYLPEFDAWSLPLWIAGAVGVTFGAQVLRWASVPIAFLWFATPLPGTAATAFSLQMQQAAAAGSTWVLQIFGQPAIRQGTTILLGDETLEVQRACSGLRMFYGILALAVAYCLVTRVGGWRRLVLLGAALPVAVLANVARITATGLALQYASGEAARTVSHDLGGLLMIPLAACVFFLLDAFLAGIERRRQDDRSTVGPYLLRWSAVALALIGVIGGWGLFQQRRVADTLLAAADRFEAEGDQAQALDYLNRYCAARPEDSDALVRLAKTYLVVRGPNGSAIDLVRRTWRGDSRDASLMLDAAEAANRSGDPSTGWELSEEVRAAKLPDEERLRAVRLAAEAAIGLLGSNSLPPGFDWDDARDALERSVGEPGYPVPHAFFLAEGLQTRSTQPPAPSADEELPADPALDRAEAVIDQLTEDNSQLATAWLARYLYLKRFPRAGENADDSLSKAVEFTKEEGPGAVGVYLTAASVAMESEDQELAIERLEQATELAPTDFRPYAMLADIAVRQGKLPEAEKSLRRGVAAIRGIELSLALPLASLLAEQGDLKAAKEVLEPIERVAGDIVGPQRGLVRLGVGAVNAQIMQRDQGPTAAAHSLQVLLNDPEVRAAGEAEPQLIAQAWQVLGAAYLELQADDLAEEAFRQAAATSPEDVTLRLKLAASSLRAGDLRAAEQEYLRLLQDRPGAADLLAALASVETQQQTRLAPEARRWNAAESRLQAAIKAGADHVQMALLSASIDAAKGEPASAITTLRESIAIDSENASLWRGLTILLAEAQKPAEALEAAEKFVTLSPQEPEALAMRASLQADMGDEKAALTDFQAALGDIDAPKPRSEATVYLARLMVRLAQYEEAFAVLEQAHTEAPADLAIAEAAAALAWLRRDEQRLETYEGWLREIEGEEGIVWRAYRVQRILGAGEEAKTLDANQAVALISRLETSRPRWPRTHYLRGELELTTGREDEAIAAYERSWALGGRTIAIADRLIDLMTRAGRFEEAQVYVGQARDFFSTSPQLFDRSIPYLNRAEEREDALRLAEGWVERQPNDPQAHLRLGRVLMVLGSADTQDAEELKIRAEAEFREAIRLAPNDITPWIASLTFYARQKGAQADALRVLADFAREAKIDEFQREFVLAQMNESLGKTAEAEGHYVGSIRLAESRGSEEELAGVLGRAALFWSQRSPELAQRCARRAVTIAPDAAAPRRTLIRLLAATGDATDRAEAISLLGNPAIEAIDTWTAADRRLVALLWIERGQGKDLENAIRILEDPLQKTLDDRLLLAIAYDRSERPEPALELFRSLATASEPRQRDMTEFLGFWRRRFVSAGSDQATQFSGVAQRVYDRLIATPAGAKAWLSLKIEEAKSRLGEEPVTVAAFDDELDSFAKALGGRDLASLAQAMAVAVDNDAAVLAEGLASSAWGDLKPVDRQRSLASVLLFRAKDAPESLHHLVRGFAKSDDLEVAQAVGDYLYLRGDYAEAEQVYRNVLNRDPDRVLAKNNLALSIAEQSGRIEEASKIIRDCLEEHGQDANLLDSLGVTRLAGADWSDASNVLQQAVELAPTSPTTLLHLAFALHRSGDEQNSGLRLFESYSNGLEHQVLTPRDREMITELERELTKEHFAPASKVTAQSPVAATSEAQP